jgi:hypothetical protein
MKKMLISIGIVLIIITSSISIAYPIKKTATSTVLSDDVPTWSIGDTWTYTINDFTIDFTTSGQRLYMDGRIDDFTWSVRSTSGSDYLIDFSGELTVDYILFYSGGSSTIYVIGTFTPALTTVTGTLTFTQSSLEIKDVTADIRGISMATIDPIPFALPIPFKITVDTELSTDFPILDFPLFNNKLWDLPNINVVADASFGGLFGLVSFPVTFTTGYSWIPFAFHCKPQTSVTVPAGTYNAYEISSLFGSFFEYYYAPTVGNIVKIDALLANGEVHGELKSTNYT